MGSFLIVKTSAIGDVIQTLPVLDYLRRREPGAKIGWVVEKSCSRLLSAHPLIDIVYEIDTKKWRKSLGEKETWAEMKQTFDQIRAQKYDVVFDLQGNCKSGLVSLSARSDTKVGFSWGTVSEKPNCFVTNTRYRIPRSEKARRRYLSLVQAYFGDVSSFNPAPFSFKLTFEEQLRLETYSKGQIMVAFGSKWKNKQLPLPLLEDFLDRISRRFSKGFLFPYGDENEKTIARRLADRYRDHSQIVGEMSLPFWQALMARSSCVIAVDSAALHLCATTTTPSFSVFGSSSGLIYGPDDRSNHAVLQGACPYKERFEKRCRLLRTCSTGACMQFFSGEELFEVFSNWIEGKQLFPGSPQKSPALSLIQ